jgi:hypothetical protein
MKYISAFYHDPVELRSPRRELLEGDAWSAVSPDLRATDGRDVDELIDDLRETMFED